MKRLKYLIFFCLAGMVAACGYKFEGGGYIQDNVTRVAVKVMENRSSESGAGLSFTNALIQELIQNTDTKVVDEPEAVAVLEGVIKSITFDDVSRSTTESVIERRVSAVVDLKLVDKDGEITWSVRDFRATEVYNVSANEVTDEANKRQAVEKIAVRTAEKIVSRLLTNF